MKKVFYLLILVLGLTTMAFTEEKESVVLIETTMGKIKIKLYNDTPLHRDNFLNLVKSGQYDNVLFHRVIKQFMIQGGDLNSKNAKAGNELGEDAPDLQTIPAEIIYPRHFHKRGTLCAAREGDETNPEFRSSGSQFYIVVGSYFTDMELDKMENKIGHKFTEEQRNAYKLEGGSPHLDGKYTVFGEVISGQKVVNKIQLVDTDENNRPIKDVRIKSMKVISK